MKLSKCIFALIAVNVFLFDLFLPAKVYASYKSIKLNNLIFSAPKHIGTPIEQSICLDSVSQVIDGKTYMYSTSSGTPPYFNVINITDQVIEKKIKLEDNDSACWTHQLDSKGNVYFGTSCNVYKYDLFSKILISFGNPFGEKGIYELKCDENDDFYFGTYPSGYLIKLDTKTGVYTNLGTPQSNSKYVRSVAYSNGKVYTGSLAAENKITVTDVTSNNRTTINFPDNIGNVKTVYSMSACGKYLLANLEGDFTEKPESGFGMAIIDTDTGEMLHFVQNSNMITPSLPYDDKIYFNAKGYFYFFNTKTGILNNTAKRANYTMRGFFKTTLNSREVMATISYGGYPIIYDILNSSVTNFENLLCKGSGVELQNLAFNSANDCLYTGGYMASYGIEYAIYIYNSKEVVCYGESTSFMQPDKTLDLWLIDEALSDSRITNFWVD